MCLKPIVPSVDRSKALGETMTECHAVLAEEAKRIYGLPNIKRLRNDYRSNQLPEGQKLSMRALSAFSRLKSIEDEVIRSFISIGKPLYASFSCLYSYSLAMTYDVCRQEGALAIYDAIYLYNGTTQFQTYVYWSIKNRLIDMVRTEQSSRHSMSKSLAELEVKINTIMGEKNLSFHQAVDLLIEKGEMKRKQVGALKKVNASHAQLSPDLISFDYAGLEQETDEMLTAVKETNLNPLERELLDAYMRGDRSYRSQLAETRKNPRTGENYTRQVLGQVFKQACEKVNRTYRGLVGSQAA